MQLAPLAVSPSPFHFVHTGVLIVVDPAYAVKVADAAHILGQLFRLGPLEVVDDGNDVTFGVECGDNFLKHSKGIFISFAIAR